jgi:hypothetical protein
VKRLVPLLLLACSARAAPPSRAPPTPSRAAFDAGEEEVLRDLAAIDARLARRARLTPTEKDLERVTMAALLGDDAPVATIGGAIDPLSFDARARGLEAAKKKAAALPDIVPERELLVRLVDAEVARVEQERALPRSSSALIRAISETWRPPSSEAEAIATDRWLARRLGEIRTSLVRGLTTIEARELDDALDAIERIATGLPATTRELVDLRDTLETLGSQKAPTARPEWPLWSPRLRTHLGIAASDDELAATLEALAAETRKSIEGGPSPALPPSEPAAFESRTNAGSVDLSERVFVEGPCVDAVPGSRVRSLAAPEERESACHLRHLVAASEDAAARRIAFAAMHDHVVVAAWALALARGTPLARAIANHALFGALGPAQRSRLERLATVRPLSALAAAETVRLLMAGDPWERAKAWRSIGDVPFDVAARELR